MNKRYTQAHQQTPWRLQIQRFGLVLLLLVVLVLSFFMNLNFSTRAAQAGVQVRLLEAERETMMKDAREIKTKMISDAKEEAKAEADKMVAQAQAAIESEKKSAIAEMKQTVASLSLEIAEKVVKHELSDSDKQLKLVNEMLSDAKLN